MNLMLMCALHWIGLSFVIAEYYYHMLIGQANAPIIFTLGHRHMKFLSTEYGEWIYRNENLLEHVSGS